MKLRGSEREEKQINRRKHYLMMPTIQEVMKLLVIKLERKYGAEPCLMNEGETTETESVSMAEVRSYILPICHCFPLSFLFPI
jgi:hypothetical protein